MSEKSFLGLIADCTRNLTKVPVNSKEFPEICQHILKSSDFLPKLTDLSAPYLWNSSYQHYPHGEFSQFPLTLHAWEKFHLDLYFWKPGRSGIHDHHFQGAFKVIAGDYFQTAFSYREEANFLPGISKGKLVSLGGKSIKPNEVEPIRMKGEFIHCVTHAEEENLTLCLRSRDLEANLNEYLLPGFKLAFRQIDQSTLSKLNHAWNQLFVFNEQTLLDKNIDILDLLRFSDKKMTNAAEAQKWWEFLLSVYESDELKELKKAFEKTRFL